MTDFGSMVYVIIESFRKKTDSNVTGVFLAKEDAVNSINNRELTQMSDTYWCNEEKIVEILVRELQ